MTPKFRAWDKYMEELVDVHTIDLNPDGSVGCIVDFHDINLDVDECVLMQSTGLKDEHGVEIFEGDILVSRQYLSHAVPSEIKGAVCYSVLKTLFYLDSEKGNQRHDIFVESLGSTIFRYYEVIGNIYENPELLEESK